MTTFYRFDQRVFLRRDPSQHGCIGRGPYNELAAKDKQGFIQFVFWEHEGADIATSEYASDLMSEQEYHERRVLFIAAMRRPEMKMVRMALWLMRDHSIEWREIQEAEVITWGDDGCWALRTDNYQIYTLNKDASDLTPYHFDLMCLSVRCGKCGMCRDEEWGLRREVGS